MRPTPAAVALATCTAVAACAQSPESIEPQLVSHDAYRTLDCAHLARALSDNGGAIEVAASQQRQAQVWDGIGVFLIGVPFASLTGNDVSDDIGRLKGERQALAQTAKDGPCDLSYPSAEEIIATTKAETAVPDPGTHH